MYVRVKIISSNPKPGEKGIAHLIGKEFDIISTDADGHYIKYGETGSYLINENEFEIIEGETNHG